MTRRAKIEAQLVDSPDDTFLNYAWALLVAGEGETEAAIQRLEWLLTKDETYVAAWFQLGQLLAKSDATARAKEVLTRGIAAARRAGDSHAEGEMRGFLESLG